MIMWIAGYPHNGSTLLRQILRQCFDIPTYSSYAEPQLEFMFGEDSVKFTKRWAANTLYTYVTCVQDVLPWFIKTHAAPFDMSPAIFVVRDGRDVVSALSRFWHIPIMDVIVGQACFFGNWSAHYYAWNPQNRENTAVIRFEDMVERADDVVRHLEQFLKTPAKRAFVDRFEENRKSWPQLFNDKGSCWQERMSDEDHELFWKCHGPLMKELGYSQDGK
jgi:hypothetical protein